MLDFNKLYETSTIKVEITAFLLLMAAVLPGMTLTLTRCRNYVFDLRLSGYDIH